MKKKDRARRGARAEIIFVISSMAMLLAFSGAFVYYLLYGEILVYPVIFGFVSFLTGFIAKTVWDRAGGDDGR